MGDGAVELFERPLDGTAQTLLDRKAVFPLVREMAATGTPRSREPVAVTCEVLGLSRHGSSQWLKNPVSQRDFDDAYAISALRQIHEDGLKLGYRFLTDELADAGICASENRVRRLCSMAGVSAPQHRRRAEAHKPGPPVHDD